MNQKNCFLTSLLGLFLSSCGTVPEQRPHEAEFSRKTFLKSQKKAICLFLDGTDNDHDSDTNVRRLYELISAERSPNKVCFYDVGVGSKENLLSGLLVGKGFSKNVQQSYDFICQNYNEGDKIYMFGFSRGARQVQILCHFISKVGLSPKSSEPTIEKRIPKIKLRYDQYKDDLKTAYSNGQYDIKSSIPKGFRNPDIEFVGIFDCVESLATNTKRGIYRRSIFKGNYEPHSSYTYTVAPNIKRGYHAIAMDEERSLYTPIKWDESNIHKKQAIEQVWFAGSHGDVGGGYKETQSMAGVSLKWMLDKLKKDDLILNDFVSHNNISTPLWNSSGFGFVKYLKLLGDLIPRGDQFWFDSKIKIINGKRYFTKTRTTPKVHESAIDRIKLPIIKIYYDTNKKTQYISESELNHKYRPRLFHGNLDDSDYTWSKNGLDNLGIYEGSPSSTDATTIIRNLKNRISTNK